MDGYCERIGDGYWDEPVNAVTNLAFLIAAYVCWRLIPNRRDRGIQLLVAILVAIGIGSYLFHTYAEPWSAAADTTPIMLFILTFVYLVAVRLYRLPWWAGALHGVGFIVLNLAVAWLVRGVVGGLNGTVGYLGVPVMIIIYVVTLWRRQPVTARRFLIGGLILCASLTFRTLDRELCAAVPLGTHFLWHILNGVMLGWMIIALARADQNDDRDTVPSVQSVSRNTPA